MKMKKKMLTILLHFMLEKMDWDDLMKWAAHGLDLLEETIAKSEKKYDKSLGNTIGQMRETFALQENN